MLAAREHHAEPSAREEAMGTGGGGGGGSALTLLLLLLLCLLATARMVRWSWPWWNGGGAPSTMPEVMEREALVGHARRGEGAVANTTEADQEESRDEGDVDEAAAPRTSALLYGERAWHDSRTTRMERGCGAPVDELEDEGARQSRRPAPRAALEMD